MRINIIYDEIRRGKRGREYKQVERVVKSFMSKGWTSQEKGGGEREKNQGWMEGRKDGRREERKKGRN